MLADMRRHWKGLRSPGIRSIKSEEIMVEHNPFISTAWSCFVEFKISREVESGNRTGFPRG